MIGKVQSPVDGFEHVAASQAKLQLMRSPVAIPPHCLCSRACIVAQQDEESASLVIYKPALPQASRGPRLTVHLDVPTGVLAALASAIAQKDCAAVCRFVLASCAEPML